MGSGRILFFRILLIGIALEYSNSAKKNRISKALIVCLLVCIAL